jgi:hypothetical protein
MELACLKYFQPGFDSNNPLLFGFTFELKITHRPAGTHKFVSFGLLCLLHQQGRFIRTIEKFECPDLSVVNPQKIMRSGPTFSCNKVADFAEQKRDLPDESKNSISLHITVSLVRLLDN